MIVDVIVVVSVVVSGVVVVVVPRVQSASRLSEHQRVSMSQLLFFFRESIAHLDFQNIEVFRYCCCCASSTFISASEHQSSSLIALSCAVRNIPILRFPLA